MMANEDVKAAEEDETAAAAAANIGAPMTCISAFRYPYHSLGSDSFKASVIYKDNRGSITCPPIPHNAHHRGRTDPWGGGGEHLE